MTDRPAITLATVFRHKEDVRYRLIDDEAVVVRQEAGEVLGLNETAARLLHLIDGGLTVEDLIGRFTEVYETERCELEKDVIQFLAELRDAGVIVESTAEGK